MVNLSRNEVSEFHYSTTLNATAQAIVPAYGTASADKVKSIRLTDLKITSGGTAATMRIEGQGGNYRPLILRVPSNTVHSFTWELPYPIDTVSSTGATREIFASATGAGVVISASGYFVSNQ